MKTLSPIFQHTISSKDWINVLDSLSIGAFTVDSNQTITSINLSALALIGLRGSEVLHKDCREIFTGVPCMVRCVLDGEPIPDDVGHDFEIRDEKDKKHPITRHSIPLYNHKNEISGCITILKDHSPIIDLVERVHHEARSLKIILDNFDAGVFTVNHGGLITYFNNAAEDILGFSKQKVLGKPYTTLFNEKIRNDFCLLKETIESGDSRKRQTSSMIDKNGVIVPVNINYMPLRNEKGTIIGGLVTFPAC